MAEVHSMRFVSSMVLDSCSRFRGIRFARLLSVAALGLGVGALGGCADEGIDDDSDDELSAEGDGFLSTADSDDEPIQVPPLAPLGVSVLSRLCYNISDVTWGVADNLYTMFELQKRPAAGGTWTTFAISSEPSCMIMVAASSSIRVRACNTFGCSGYTEAGNITYFYPGCVF